MPRVLHPAALLIYILASMAPASAVSSGNLSPASGAQMGERHLPGGVRSRWERDKLGRPVKHEIWSGRKLVGAKSYVWQPNDRLKMIVDALRGPVQFTHDGLGNLTAAACDGKIDLRMPDAVGNLFKTNERRDRKYGPAGQLLESYAPEGVTRYSYDPEGNLALKVLPDGRQWKYEWNPAGMLAKVIRPDGEVEFGYDALGRRVWKKYQGKTTKWVWDGNVPVHEWVEVDPAAVPAPSPVPPAATSTAAIHQRAIDLSEQPAQGPPPSGPLAPQSGEREKEGSSSPLAPRSGERVGVRGDLITWIFEPESFAPIAKLTGNEQHSIITDHLGTPTAMLDQSGKTLWSADISIYGELRNVVGDKHACPFRWPGQYEDAETGLYYNRFRYYDPDAGEYVSQDPIGMAGGARLTAYVHDPLTWVDPFGLAGRCGTKKVIVLGEGMPRVKTAARDLKKAGVDAKWYQAWGKNFPKGRAMTPAELTASKTRNARWLKQKMKEGYEIRDIGLDSLRPASERSPFYALEKQMLNDAGYSATLLPGY